MEKEIIFWGVETLNKRYKQGTNGTIRVFAKYSYMIPNVRRCNILLCIENKIYLRIEFSCSRFARNLFRCCEICCCVFTEFIVH
jgi:hypothetical protein